MNEPTNNGTAETVAPAETYPIDDALISLVADIGKAEQQLQQQAIALNAQRNGALVLFIRQHNLQGNWKIAENGRELVKQPDAPAPA
jgi:hypothetical protein